MPAPPGRPAGRGRVHVLGGGAATGLLLSGARRGGGAGAGGRVNMGDGSGLPAARAAVVLHSDALSRESLRRETVFCHKAAVCQRDFPKTRVPGLPISEGARRFSKTSIFICVHSSRVEIALSCVNV